MQFEEVCPSLAHGLSLPHPHKNTQMVCSIPLSLKHTDHSCPLDLLASQADTGHMGTFLPFQSFVVECSRILQTDAYPSLLSLCTLIEHRTVAMEEYKHIDMLWCQGLALSVDGISSAAEEPASRH